MTEDDKPTKLLWIDLEMTGLEPKDQRIIEVAAVVTDFKLDELGDYHSIMHQPAEVIEAAEDWPKANMQDLLKQSKESEKAEITVIEELESFIDQSFGDEKVYIAGNSIHQDRRFIRRWWPQIDKRLHYRMFDVSTLKIWVQGNSDIEYRKAEVHRAMDDIRESIAELKWSLDRMRELES